MGPIQPFSHDAAKYVNQNPDVRIVNRELHPVKPFQLNKSPDKSEKAKKDLGKNKDKESKEEGNTL